MSAYYKKKYKPWRKGKSTKHNGGDTTGGITSAKSHGSLKQQLRGLKRLQQKKMKDRAVSNNDTLADEQQLQQQEQEIQEKIDALQEQIQMRTISEKERVNAKKSHKLRFVDRQRTTRLYQQYIKQLQQLEEQLQQITSTDSNDTTVNVQQQQRNKINDDLYRLALDQIYIAHFPLDRTSYVSLFNPTNHNHAVVNSSSSSNATQMPTQQQQRRTVMNNRLLHKMATQRQCIIERLNKTHQINIETKHQNQMIEEEDDDTHHEANHPTNNTNKIPSDKTICSSTTKRIQPVSWIHPSQYERIQHLSTWSTQLERTTFQITIVNDNSTSDTGKSKSSHDDDDDDDMVQSSSEVDTTTDNRTDERFHNVTATFNTTQQLLLQEQERMERELSTLEDDEEEENKDDEVAEQSQLITTKGTKHRTANTTRVASTYDNDDSDASGDSSNSNDDEMDDDDDNNVDPLQRSVGAVVAKVFRENDEITGDIEDEDDDSDSSSSEQSSDSVSISSQPDNTSNTINYNDTENSQMATSQDEVIAMATNLRKLASQKGKVSTNNNHKSVEMEEEDDFFVSLDDDNDKDHELHPTSKNVNVFANAKRDTIRYNHSHNGTGDKSQGWVTQKQLPGQFRKKQRR